jgi:hypothetical protein
LIRKYLILRDDISEICLIKVLKNDDLQANTAIQIKAEIVTFELIIIIIIIERADNFSK